MFPVVCLAELMDIGQNSVVMEVEEGMIEGDIHGCLFPKGVPPDRFLMGANIGAGEEIDHVAWLSAPHGSVEGQFSQTWRDPCSQVSHWGLSFKGHMCLDLPVDVSGRVPGVPWMFRVVDWQWQYIEQWL